MTTKTITKKKSAVPKKAGRVKQSNKKSSSRKVKDASERKAIVAARKHAKQLAIAEPEIQVSDPIVKEIAGEIGHDLERFQYMMKTHNPNPIHKNPKFTGLHLFEEMDTDSRVYNVMRIRKDGLRRRKSWIRPGDSSEDQAIKTANTIYNLKKIDDLKQKKKEVTACLDFGYTFTELIVGQETYLLEYEYKGEKKTIEMKNAWVIKDLRSRPVTAFWFDDQNRAYFAGNSKESDYFGLFRNGSEGRLLTARELQRFMIVTHDPRWGSRSGWSVKIPMFPPYLSKKAARVWRLLHVHHHAMPIPHGKYPRGPGAPGKTGVGGTDEFKKKLQALHQATYLMTPEGFAVEFLKAMATGDLDPYQNLLDYSDYEIAESGLGHREATSQAGTGSYASEVLKSTALRQEILEADGGMLDTAFNDQYIKRLCDWNFPSTGIYPKQYTDVTAMRDLSATISQYETGHSMGIDHSKAQIRREMGWEPPVDDDDRLVGNPNHVFPDRTSRKPNPSEQP